MAQGFMGMKRKDDKTNLRKTGDATADLIAMVDSYVDQAGVILSVMDPQYDGGDFCQGLTVGFEIRQLSQAFVLNAITSALPQQKRPR